MRKLVSTITGREYPFERRMLTGAGLKDLDALKYQPFNIIDSNLERVRHDINQALK